MEIATAPPGLSREGPPREGDTPDGFLGRPQVRDVIAWLRLLVDPEDASAVARALARPPVELRQVDLARVIQVARRRKLDLVVGVGAAIESPQVPPEARERIERFASLHRVVEAELHSLEPAEFLAALIDRLGLLRRRLMTPVDAARSNEGLRSLQELAGRFLAEHPGAETIDLVRHLAAVAAQHHERSIAPGPAEQSEERLERIVQALREELAQGIGRIGDRLGELRLDTDLDISHGVVRYLELLKVSALIQRPPGRSWGRRSPTSTPACWRRPPRCSERSCRPRPSIRPCWPSPTRRMLPRARSSRARSSRSSPSSRGAAPAWRCRPRTSRPTWAVPLRYKFARVLRIPAPQTVQQRFGIVIHQVLERYHSGSDETLEALLELLEQVWRRSALGETEHRPCSWPRPATPSAATTPVSSEESVDPVWFERSFSFRVGPHHLRGRVDRVDRLPDGAEHRYELIDYKTSRPRTPEQLSDDVQLSLYAMAAREDWQLESSSQAYYYVLDDLKVPVPDRAGDAQALEELVLEVGDGILGQRFEPTPSPSACAYCDYRVMCPAAEVA